MNVRKFNDYSVEYYTNDYYTRQQILDTINGYIEDFNDSFHWQDAEENEEFFEDHQLTDEIINKFFTHQEDLKSECTESDHCQDLIRECQEEWLKTIHPILKLRNI